MVTLVNKDSKDIQAEYSAEVYRQFISCRSSNLTDNKCKNLRDFYKDKKAFMLMRHKDLYPYEWMDGWERFDKTKLPSKNVFYSR